MKKSLSILFCCLLSAWLAGCAPSASKPEAWGSFTRDPVVSSDGLYRAEHEVVTIDGISMIQVSVYDAATNELLDCFMPARAMDFRGICWEDGTHRIWTQSADIGIDCYELQDGRWTLNENAEQPDSVISKWDVP